MKYNYENKEQKLEISIAHMLLAGNTFAQIRKKHNVSFDKIQKVYLNNKEEIDKKNKFEINSQIEDGASTVTHAYRTWLDLRIIYEQLKNESIDEDQKTKEFAIKMLPIYFEKMNDAYEHYIKLSTQHQKNAYDTGGLRLWKNLKNKLDANLRSNNE